MLTRQISHRGFLPYHNPLQRLSDSYYQPWEDTIKNLPELIAANTLRRVLEELPVLDTVKLKGRELQRAMSILCFFMHGHRGATWKKGEAIHIPVSVGLPLYQVAGRLHLPTVLSYGPYALWNWKLLDPQGPFELENLTTLLNFLGGSKKEHEDWFVIIHVKIEHDAAAALHAMPKAQAAVRSNDQGVLAHHLRIMARSFEQMSLTLGRMTEHCDPAVYYEDVRPWLFGFPEDNPLVLDGIPALNDVLQVLAGESGIESTIAYAVRAVLGIVYSEDDLMRYERGAPNYMPLRHRCFVQDIEQGPSIRDHLLKTTKKASALRALYNACLRYHMDFLEIHYKLACEYIRDRLQRDKSNPTAVGTFGSPFLRLLKKHIEETRALMI